MHTRDYNLVPYVLQRLWFVNKDGAALCLCVASKC